MVTKAKKGNKNTTPAAAENSAASAVTVPPAVALVGLAAIVKATAEGGFSWVGSEEAKMLANDGLVEVNASVEGGPAGCIATRATEKGIASMNAVAASEFEIESGVELPKIRTGGGRLGTSKYPFDKLEVGQAFFVAKKSEDLASTISAANKRYAVAVTDENGKAVMRTNRKGKTVPATKQTRKFVMRAAEKNGTAGTRIFRVPVEQ